MAGMGPAPKHPSMRQRNNRTSTAALLKVNPTARVPKLPPLASATEGEDWHPMVVAMWKDAWKSPMAGEFVDSDKHGMYVVAMLYQDFYTATSPRLRAELAAEIRLSGQRFGFSPIDRRRLQWEVERTEDAQERGARRRAARAEPAPVEHVRPGDPRGVLRAL